jgi:hypothetical protein
MGQVLYWLLTGALIGFGFIGIFSIGLPFLVVGLGLLVFGLIRFKGRGFWAALLGVGGLPAIFFLADIVTAPPPCPPDGITVPASATGGFSCSGSLDSYRMLAVVFSVIALVGIVWGLLQRLLARR